MLSEARAKAATAEKDARAAAKRVQDVATADGAGELARINAETAGLIIQAAERQAGSMSKTDLDRKIAEIGEQTNALFEEGEKEALNAAGKLSEASAQALEAVMRDALQPFMARLERQSELIQEWLAERKAAMWSAALQTLEQIEATSPS